MLFVNLSASTYVLKWVDALGGLLDLTANDLWDELGGELAEGAAAGLAGDDLGHLLADLPDLGSAGVCGLLDLIWPSLGESDGEEAEEVVVGGLDDNVGLNQGLPLAHKGPELVGGEVETVEVGQAVLALDLVDPEPDLAERVVLILLEVGERNLENAALEGVVGVLQTGGAVDEGLADIADGEGAWGLEGVPVLDMFVSFLPPICDSACGCNTFLWKGSVLFFKPFLPLDNLLFFPTAMVAMSDGKKGRSLSVVEVSVDSVASALTKSEVQAGKANRSDKILRPPKR